MTIKEMKNYQKYLSKQVMELGKSFEVTQRHIQLLTKTNNNHFYLRTNSKKEEVENYLEQYINAIYDCRLENEIKF